jgi:predicted acylesterase/phospholipase RssA
MADAVRTDAAPVDRVFEVGLVMAGAISAGAYTAGVADFLIEALDQWYAFNKAKGYSPHEIKIRVVSGASAGGMTGAIMTAAFGGEFPPVRRRPQGRSDNPLYRAWVQDIDIQHLLASNDIEAIRAHGEVEKQAKIRNLRRRYYQKRLSLQQYEEAVAALNAKTLVSLLDSTRLSDIAEEAVNVTPSLSAPLSERRPYLPERFELFLSIANLRGVPYLLDLHGGASRMVTHADFMHFALMNEGPADRDRDADGNEYVTWMTPSADKEFVTRALWLNPANYKDSTWKSLSKAALATGAFPFGLAPVTLRRVWTEYKDRTFAVSRYEDGVYTRSFQTLPPEPNALLDKTNAYEFMSVDGGLLDNAPFDLAHRALTEKLGERNERNPGLTNRAIILIAPFPDSAEPETYREPNGLMAIAGAILGSLMKQVRFNPEELILASDPNVGSRFLISPVRSPPHPKLPYGDIACGTLGGFGGFLSEEFRHHDFMLGRRNCQRFLQSWFKLPATNDLFKNWDEDMKRRFYLDPPPNSDNSERHLPIIPLVGTADPATHEVKLEPWPTYSTAQLDKLSAHAERRLTSVSHFFIDMHAGRSIAAIILRIVLWWQKPKVMRQLRSAVQSDLTGYGIPWTGESKPSVWRRVKRIALAAAAIVVLALVATVALKYFFG